METNDTQIVDSILRRGDTQAYALIVKRYSGLVVAKAMGVLHDEDLAAEAAQQTFVRAYSRLDYWGGGSSLGPWLSVLAAHVAINLLAKRRARREEELADEHDAPADDEASALHEARLEKMHRAMRELPEADREMLRLFYSQGAKTADIARRLGLSAANVLVRLHRVRERLRQRITEMEKQEES